MDEEYDEDEIAEAMKNMHSQNQRVEVIISQTMMEIEIELSEMEIQFSDLPVQDAEIAGREAYRIAEEQGLLDPEDLELFSLMFREALFNGIRLNRTFIEAWS